MKIIDNIKDFHKIKVGYTISLGAADGDDKEIIKEILIVDYDQKIIVIIDKTQDDEYNTIRDVFQCNDIIDIVFPCSLDQAAKNFPEYFI
jgi:hypothetical protein